MINFIKKGFLFIFFSIILVTFLVNPYVVINSVNYSVNVFVSNILPTLLPFFILADALINYNYIEYISYIFKFKYSNIILMSMISGLPSNAKYVSVFLSKNLISKKDASIVLSSSFFPNPMFVIGSVGALMLGSIKLGISLLIINYLANFILYFCYYKKLDDKNMKVIINRENFSTFIKSSILKNMETMLVILGTIVIFVTLSNVIFNLVNLSPVLKSIIGSMFEMTSGVKKMSELFISLHSKFILISLSLAFSGFSIIVQALSIISEYDLDIKFILKNKVYLLLITLIIDYAYIIFFM